MPFESMNTPIEIERKFLIHMPDMEALVKLDNVRIKNIEQTYLLTRDKSTARVRKISEDERISFVKTVKKRISALSHYEDEGEIDREQYEKELKNADPQRSTIVKTRYAFPFCAHTVEIDVYPFWKDRAILEIELADENESFDIPKFIKVIKEVSDDGRYKNTNLAVKIPMDNI